MNIEEALQKLRNQKDQPESPGFLMYQLLETAHPIVREALEYQAAHALMAGERISESFREASSTAEGREFIEKKFSDLAAKINSVDFDKTEDDGDLNG